MEHAAATIARPPLTLVQAMSVMSEVEGNRGK